MFSPRHECRCLPWPALLAALAALGLGRAALGSPDPDAAKRCLSCHTEDSSEHLAGWGRSVHAHSDVTCRHCHGAAATRMPGKLACGNPRPTRAEAGSTCGRCHAAVKRVFDTSRHHRRARQGAKAPTCTDCHVAAGGSVLVAEQLSTRCGLCHQASDHEGSMGSRAAEVLALLRKVTLARVLVQQRRDRLARRGEPTASVDTTLAGIDRVFSNIATEWHRFALPAAREHSHTALEALESVHQHLRGRE